MTGLYLLNKAQSDPHMPDIKHKELSYANYKAYDSRKSR